VGFFANEERPLGLKGVLIINRGATGVSRIILILFALEKRSISILKEKPSIMPHNNVQSREHAYAAEHMVHQHTSTTSVGNSAMLDHYNKSAPTMMLPQAPPVIHRGAHPAPPGGVVMVYVPTSHHHHHQHHAAPGHALHMVPGHHHYAEVAYATPTQHRQHAAIATAPPTASPPSEDDDVAKNASKDNSNNKTSGNKRSHSTTASASFDSQHEVAHSVLMLASAAKEHERRNSAGSAASDASSASNEEHTKVPFKKRKMVSDIIRSKTNNNDGAFHVSPVSHGSKTAEALPAACSPDRSHASHNSSYEDIKGGQALLDSSKVSEGKNIAPPTTVTVTHFPWQLYNLLANSSSPSSPEQGVLEWCSHGKAWRIVRWDALRKLILPKYFGGASVDSFLADLTAWGFTEVNDGNDAGAYSHTLFRRGFPNLCKEIQKLDQAKSLVGDDSKNATPQQQHGVHRSDSPSNSSHNSMDGSKSRASAPSILQVPSLGDAGANGTSDSSAVSSSADEAKQTETAPTSPTESKRVVGQAQVSTTSSPSPSHSSASTYWHFHQPPMYIPYRQEDSFQHASEYQQPAPIVWAPVADSMTPALPAYSPVRVRSARGAARVSARLPAAQVTPNPSRHGVSASRGFPVVSNRGRRTGSVMRSSGSWNHSPSGALHHHPANMPSPTGSSTTTTTTTTAGSPLRPALKRTSPVAPTPPSVHENRSSSPHSSSSPSPQPSAAEVAQV